MAFKPYPILPGKNYQKVDVLDLVVLLGNVWKGNQDRMVGFEDAEQTIQELTAKLNHSYTIKITDIESSLWSCNLLAELGKFWHPRGLSFDEFVKKLIKEKRYDTLFNVIEDPKK